MSDKLLPTLQHCLAIFKSMADRGRYPQELLPDSPHYLGKQGWEFLTDVIADVEKSHDRERKLQDFISNWIHDSALQSFADRERFRKAGRHLLGYTFEEFRATGHEVDELDDDEGPGRVYAGGTYINRYDGTEWCLTICNESWATGIEATPDGADRHTLEGLERKLYDWAVKTDIIYGR